jgi:hypothetical protein
MYDILKVSGLILEMVNSLEMYVICCIASRGGGHIPSAVFSNASV